MYCCCPQGKLPVQLQLLLQLQQWLCPAATAKPHLQHAASISVKSCCYPAHLLRKSRAGLAPFLHLQLPHLLPLGPSFALSLIPAHSRRGSQLLPSTLLLQAEKGRTSQLTRRARLNNVRRRTCFSFRSVKKALSPSPCSARATCGHATWVLLACTAARC